ncbi:MAG: hypothetical protein GC159_09645 [Phycisphaera sp.]|nr:hypothetical protein [Phycisphaera sp.]
MAYHDEDSLQDDDLDDAIDDEEVEAYTLPCPHCGEEVWADADVCPHCRSFISDADFERAEHDGDQLRGWSVLIIIVMVILMLALMMLR